MYTHLNNVDGIVAYAQHSIFIHLILFSSCYNSNTWITFKERKKKPSICGQENLNTRNNLHMYFKQKVKRIGTTYIKMFLHIEHQKVEGIYYLVGYFYNRVYERGQVFILSGGF